MVGLQKSWLDRHGRNIHDPLNWKPGVKYYLKHE
jgi:hypothetical protein